MVLQKTQKGYRWGDSGSVYPTREQAESQAAAAFALNKTSPTIDGRVYVSRGEVGNADPKFDVYQGVQGGMFYYPNGGKPGPEVKAKVVRRGKAEGQGPTPFPRKPEEGGQQPQQRPEGKERPRPTNPTESPFSSDTKPEKENRPQPNPVPEAKKPTVPPDTNAEGKKPDERQPHRPQPRGQGDEEHLGFQPGQKPHIPEGLPPTADALARMVDWAGTRGEVREALIDMALSDRFYARRPEDLGRIRFGPKARNVAARSMDNLISIVMRENGKTNKAQLNLKNRRHTVGSQDPFKVRQSDSGETLELPEARVYLKEGEEAPSGVSVQEGPRGGWFFMLPARSRPLKSKDLGGKGEDVLGDPEGAGEQGPQEEGNDEENSQTADVEPLAESTIQRIRSAMRQAKIPQSTGPAVPGFELIEAHEEFDVIAHGPDTMVQKVAKAMEAALREAGLQFHAEGPVMHVKPLPGDKDEDVVGDQLKVKPIKPPVPKPTTPKPDDNPLKIKNALTKNNLSSRRQVRDDSPTDGDRLRSQPGTNPRPPEGARHESVDMVAPPAEERGEMQGHEDPAKTQALKQLIDSLINNPLIMEAIKRAEGLKQKEAQMAEQPMPQDEPMPQNEKPPMLDRPGGDDPMPQDEPMPQDMPSGKQPMPQDKPRGLQPSRREDPKDSQKRPPKGLTRPERPANMNRHGRV